MTTQTALPARTRKFLAALKAAGWKLSRGNFPGNYRAASPVMDTERPTPDYIRYGLDGRGQPMTDTRGPYPFDTYTPLRLVSFNIDESGRIYFLQSRTGVPWVGACDQKLSMPAALRFVAEPADA